MTMEGGAQLEETEPRYASLLTVRAFRRYMRRIAAHRHSALREMNMRREQGVAAIARGFFDRGEI